MRFTARRGIRRVATAFAAAATVLGLAACGGSSHPARTSSTTTTAPTTTPTTPVTRPLPTAGGESSAILQQVNVHYPEGTAAEQTAPTVSPAAGSRTGVFTVHLTVRSTLGPHGYARRDYEVLLAGIRPRCALWTELDAGALGAKAEVVLHPPYDLGWCAGAYHGRILLQSTASCPPRTSTTAPPCRTSPPRYAVVGRFTFLAR